MQTSVDGYIEGPNKELDWAMVEDEDAWREMDETLIGRHHHPGTSDVSSYEQYWLALLANPVGRRMRMPMHVEPIRYPISSFPRPWKKWYGR